MFSFNISNKILESYKARININNELIFNYNSESLRRDIKLPNLTIYLYGYCFDIRNPKLDIEETFHSIRNKNDLENLLPFLNGQFIIIADNNKDLFLYLDASSTVPVFINNSNVTTEKVSETRLNPNYKINLKTGEVTRWYIYKRENTTDSADLQNKLKDFLINQFDYFTNKNLVMRFKKDNYFKSLVAILKPVLFNNTLLFDKEKGTVFENYFHDILVDEYRLKQDENNHKFSSSTVFYCKSNLNNSKVIFKKKNDSLNDIQETTLIEENLMKISSTSNRIPTEKYLVYEPLNARALLEIVNMLNNVKNFSLNNQIINMLSPSLTYYNFSRDKTLSDINTEQKVKIKSMIDNSMASENEKFLLDAKTHHFKLSRNLAGNIRQGKLVTYPYNQVLDKTTNYTIDVSMNNYEFLFVKSFYNNLKNSKRIIVKINDDEYTIDELNSGIYYNTHKDVKISMRYKNNYRGLSWQKAGTLLITRS